MAGITLFFYKFLLVGGYRLPAIAFFTLFSAPNESLIIVKYLGWMAVFAFALTVYHSRARRYRASVWSALFVSISLLTSALVMYWPIRLPQPDDDLLVWFILYCVALLFAVPAAANFYRCVKTLWSTPWGEMDQDAKPSKLSLMRVAVASSVVLMVAMQYVKFGSAVDLDETVVTMIGRSANGNYMAILDFGLVAILVLALLQCFYGYSRRVFAQFFLIAIGAISYVVYAERVWLPKNDFSGYFSEFFDSNWFFFMPALISLVSAMGGLIINPAI